MNISTREAISVYACGYVYISKKIVESYYKNFNNGYFDLRIYINNTTMTCELSEANPDNKYSTVIINNNGILKRKEFFKTFRRGNLCINAPYKFLDKNLVAERKFDRNNTIVFTSDKK